jgi:tetratricopeptide (TPR) repeat protein
MSNHTLFDDYLMRMMRPFVQAMGDILFAKKERKTQKALEIIGQTSQKLLGMDASLLSRLSDEYLYQLLEKYTGNGAIRCLVLAALLKEEADVYLMMGDEDGAIARWTKALRIYLDILHMRDMPEVGNHLANMQEMADRLRGHDISVDLRHRLFGYFERKSLYAEAENVLWDMLDSLPDNAELLDEGIAFYQRLAALHPARLVAGKLPIEEVQSGLAYIQSVRAGL